MTTMMIVAPDKSAFTVLFHVTTFDILLMSTVKKCGTPIPDNSKTDFKIEIVLFGCVG